MAVAARWDDNDTQLLIEIIKEETSCNDVILNLEDSYIDHESVGIAEFLFKSKEALRDFIFNSHSHVFVV